MALSDPPSRPTSVRGSLLRLGAGAERGLDLAQHGVERPSQPAHLGPRVPVGNPARQVTVGDGGRGFLDVGERPQAGPDHRDPDDGQDDDDGPAHQQVDVGQVPDGLVDVTQVGADHQDGRHLELCRIGVDLETDRFGDHEPVVARLGGHSDRVARIGRKPGLTHRHLWMPLGGQAWRAALPRQHQFLPVGVQQPDHVDAIAKELIMAEMAAVLRDPVEVQGQMILGLVHEVAAEHGLAGEADHA
jgi:hypothetical protein